MKTWRGVIEEYRDFLPVSDKTPVVTLFEGNTPLYHAPASAQYAGLKRLALKHRRRGRRHDHSFVL